MVEKSLGHRVSLDHLAQATLGSKKSGHGFLAIEYFRSQQWDKLESYCLDDVRLTKDLYDYALKNKKLLFQSFNDKAPREIPLKFETAVENPVSVHLSLPF